MLKVFVGNREKVRDAVQQFLSKSGPNAQVISFDESALPEAVLPFLEHTDLFGSRSFVRLDGVFANEELKQVVLSRLGMLVASPNVFALIEGKLDAETATLFKESGVSVLRFASEKDKPAFNPFSLSDALIARDKKMLWVRYREALEAGEAPEALAGILFWQLKVCALVAAGETADIHPYTVSKTKTALRKYSADELKRLAFRLVSLYHESRLGKGELSERLERMILSV